MAENLKSMAAFTSKDDPTAWIARYKAVFIATGMEAAHYKRLFPLVCDQTAFAALLSTGVLADDKTWADVEAMMLTLWGPKGGDQAARTAVLQRRQQPGEAVSAFAADFAVLVSRVPNQRLDDWTGQFRASLRASISKAMLAHTTDTWAAAVKMAGTVEAAEVLEAPAAAPAAEPEAAMAVVRRAPPTEHRTRRRFDGACWSCGRKGHKASECRSPRSSSHLREVHDAYSMGAFMNVSKATRNARPHLIVAAQVGEVTARALVDSGAQVSAISQAFAERIGRRPSSSKAFLLVSADGAPLTNLGAAPVQVTVNGWPQRHSFQVIPGMAWDMILGYDFLQATSAIVDAKAGTVSLGSSTVAAVLAAPDQPAAAPAGTILDRATYGSAVPVPLLKAMLISFISCFAVEPSQFGSARVEPLHMSASLVLADPIHHGDLGHLRG